MASRVKPQSTDAFFKPPREFKRRGPGGFPIGKQTIRRAKENRQLAKLNIRRCEIMIPGVCVKTIMLTWAHGKKVRYLLTSKDWQEAARSCLPCHDYIEPLGHKKMRAIVLAAIKRRKPPNEQHNYD